MQGVQVNYGYCSCMYYSYVALYLAYVQKLFTMTKAAVSACACNIQCVMRNGSLKAGQNVTITIN